VLGEISFVPIAADSKTSVSVAASHKEIHMNKQFREWLEAKGFEPDELTDQQAATLKAAFDGENAPEPPAPPANRPRRPQAPPVDPIAKATADMREALAAEKNARGQDRRGLQWQAPRHRGEGDCRGVDA
jgi:hypothetical protein